MYQRIYRNYKIQISQVDGKYDIEITDNRRNKIFNGGWSDWAQAIRVAQARVDERIATGK